MGIKVYQVKSASSGFGMFQRSAESISYDFLESASEYAAWVAQENNLVSLYSLDADEAEMGDEDGEKIAAALREVDGRVQGGQGSLVAFLIGDEIQIESVEDVR